MRKTKENIGSNTGITLVALVITIVVLLILAGVTLTMVVGDSGIFAKAQEAKRQTNIANIKEQIKIEITDIQANNQGNITDEQLKVILQKYGTINYEEDSKTIKSITTNENKYEILIEQIYKGKTIQEDKQLATKVITSQNYGDDVNYSANGVDSWKIFLNDGKNVYIIASNYVPNNAMSMKDGITNGNGDYCVKADNRDELVNWLNKEVNWIKYAESISGAIATGSPTLGQFWLSYNKKYSTNYSGEYQDLSNHEGYNDTLYFPHKEIWNECEAYWLASAYSDTDTHLLIANTLGVIGAGTCSVPKLGVRPIICLPSNIHGTKNEGRWTFTN